MIRKVKMRNRSSLDDAVQIPRPRAPSPLFRFAKSRPTVSTLAEPPLTTQSHTPKRARSSRAYFVLSSKQLLQSYKASELLHSPYELGPTCICRPASPGRLAQSCPSIDWIAHPPPFKVVLALARRSPRVVLTLTAAVLVRVRRFSLCVRVLNLIALVPLVRANGSQGRCDPVSVLLAVVGPQCTLPVDLLSMRLCIVPLLVLFVGAAWTVAVATQASPVELQAARLRLVAWVIGEEPAVADVSGESVTCDILSSTAVTHLAAFFLPFSRRRAIPFSEARWAASSSFLVAMSFFGGV